MQIETSPIPEGSHEVRIWLPGDDSRVDPLRTVMNLLAHGDTAVVSMAHGTLSNAINVGIGFKALELGFTRLEFYVVRGQQVTRWAQYVRSDSLYDYYTIDLAAAAARFTQENS